jgi:hypothetical protein
MRNKVANAPLKDQPKKESRRSSISKTLHEDETNNNHYFFSSLLGDDFQRFNLLAIQFEEESKISRAAWKIAS